MSISTLLLGTGNPQKIAHYKKFLRDCDIKIITAGELNLPEPEENGKTFEENALLKAKHYYTSTKIPTLADDAGLEIPALGNFPGVRSARFAGRDMTDEEIISGILEKMRDLAGADRQARIKIVLALQLSESETHVATAVIEGVVPRRPYDKRMKYFAYRSLLFVSGLNKWFYDITEEDEERLGYRKAAVEELKKYLR